MPDIADLYDFEIKTIGEILRDLAATWGNKRNTKQNLQEFAKYAHSKFLEAGFVVNVQWENTLVMVPDVSAPGGIKPLPITIEVIDRIAGGTGLGEVVEGHELMDHERKRYEVLRANERGEDYLGQKGNSA